MKYFVTGFIIVFCLSAAIYVGYLRVRMDKPIDPTYVVTAGLPIGGDFKLTSHEGKPVSTEDFRGKVMLLYFGYTYCPDFCPTELAEVSDALNQLGDDAKNVQPIFITIDPHRDTQDVMAEYVQLYHPQLLGLYGNDHELKQAMEAYRIYSAKTHDEGDDGYLMDHSTFVYLVGKDGQLKSLLRYGTPADVMAKEIRKLFYK